MGGSPGLVVMGGASCSKGREFEFRYRILDGHFFTFNCYKNCNLRLKKTKINEKEVGVGPFLCNRFHLQINFILLYLVYSLRDVGRGVGDGLPDREEVMSDSV